MSILYKAFGFLMKICYDIFENLGGYAIALLAFSLLVQIVLFPFSIKQQKNSQKQAKLRPKEAAIRKKYAGRTDRETQMKMNEEIQKLYQEEHFSPFAGCLPLLIQFPIIIALFNVIQQPLTYISGMDSDLITGITEVAKKVAPDMLGEAHNIEINLVRIINEHGAEFANLTKGFVIPDFSMFGSFMDLSMVPMEAFNGHLQLIIIPIATFLSAFFGQKLTRKFMYQPGAATPDSGMKVMNFIMPLFSAYLAFSWPAVMGLYWTYRSILAFVQQVLLSKMFPIPTFTEEELKAAEKAYAAQNKSKPYKASDNAGRKSLIFDDDDEEETTATTAKQNKSIVSDDDDGDDDNSSSGGDSVIPKAPLK